jgi:hypothetical protein
LIKVLHRIADIFYECLKAGKLQVHPLQITGTEEDDGIYRTATHLLMRAVHSF